MKEVLVEIGIPFAAFILFLLFQSIGRLNEWQLVFFIVIVSVFIFLMRYHQHEGVLFLVGIFFGIIVEIGLRYFGYQQVWKDASLSGVPVWLPLVWGIGFVIITRLGLFIRNF